MFVNWENIDINSEEKQQDSSPSITKQSASIIREENERKRSSQLKKIQYHKNANEHRKDFIVTMTKFGELLINNEIEEIACSFLTEDCETFLFNFAEVSPVQFSLKNEGFTDLFKDYQLIQREVKDSYMDLEKMAGFQMCYCLFKNKKEDSTTFQFSFEAFSFRNMKISKYRASFGIMESLSDAQSLFTPSRKERMLAKVKELNYAFVDQPDLEKIASLFNENTEYKIWRWKDKKRFTFNKLNIASDFRKSLEEDFEIKSIVPFDASVEAQYVVGSYVYYLEGKGELSGKRYNWISTCIFAFDKDVNITKLSHQGDLYEEDEVLIPDEVHLSEKIKEKVYSIYSIGNDSGLSILSSEEIQFSFDLGIFSTSGAPITGLIRGLREYKKLTQMFTKRISNFELLKPIDIYQGLDDPCYDIAITTDYTKGVIYDEGSPLNGKLVSIYGIRKYSFENGRLAKVIIFLFALPEPIPSPYDDDNFTDLNIIPKKEFLQV